MTRSTPKTVPFGTVLGVEVGLGQVFRHQLAMVSGGQSA